MADDKFKNIQDLIAKQREFGDLKGEEYKLLVEYNELLEQQNEKGDKKLKRLKETLIKKEEELALAHQLADMGLKLEGHYDTIYAAEEAKLKLARQNVLEMKRGNAVQEEAYQLALKINTEEQNALKARKEAAGYTEGLIARMTGISDKPTSGIAKMFSNPEGFAKGFKDGVGKMITPMNLMTSTIDKVVETTMALALEQDAAISNFRKATGATGAFDDDIIKLEKDLRTAGVTSAEAAESVQELYLNVSGFTEMGSEAREEMAGMVAALSEVGVAAADSTKNIQIAIKGLGMSGKEATALQSELRSFAQGINVSTGQMAKDFATMGPQISAMGDKGVGAFEKLQVTMKETGLEMSTMLKLVEQFDTFDGAGQQVGKLNALLGGPFLNTLELVSETDLGARMEKLRDGVMAAGLSFDDMDYYQKKAYTSALGLNSEMELAMFLGNNMDSIIPDEKTAEEYEEIAKQTAQFNDVMEELRQAGMSLAVSMRPLVTVIKDFLGVIQVIGPGITALVAGLFTLRAVLHLNTWATAAYTAAKNAGNAATIGGIFYDKIKAALSGSWIKTLIFMTGAKNAKTAATVLETTSESALATAQLAAITAIISGTAVESAAIPVKASLTTATITTASAFQVMGFSANTSMGIIGGLALAIVALAAIFLYDAGSPGFIVILAMVSLAFIGMGIAANAFGWSISAVLPFILAFAAAILMIGLGIGIAAAGMALFVSSVNSIGIGLATSMLATAMAIRQIVDAIDDVPLTKTLALTAAVLPLAAMAPVAALASAGIGAVTRGLGGGAESGGAAGASGPPAVINVRLSVDGTEFATAVNKVEVGNKVTSKLHQTFVDQVSAALLAKT